MLDSIDKIEQSWTTLDNFVLSWATLDKIYIDKVYIDKIYIDRVSENFARLSWQYWTGLHGALAQYG